MINDWTQYQDINESYRRTILTATFALTKDNVINALRCDYVFIQDKYYKTPKHDLLNLLQQDIVSNKAICVELELEQSDL